MDTAPLKSFATWARTALIREVTARITVVLAPASPQRVEQPKAIAALESAINAAGGGDKGRGAVADRVAYTWFNRIIALRFMDANGYTGIGVVSPQAGVEVGQPEILAEAKRANIEPDVVDQKIRDTVTGLLNGTRRSDDPQGEAYALLLVEYCRHWNRAMPFMFERQGDFTELLMPASLLADDSVLNRAVNVLTEAICQDVEVIGWLYQFYISERKDEVFAGFKKNLKAGAAEIPSATQLFTPHWIVRYLIENSLGRLWMLNNPSSRLIDQMDYYISPLNDETDFLKINSPEEIKLIDPASGSGHLLTYAFDLLYAIYEEQGYTPSDIPALILTNNLYGTEIDPRSGALAAFALTMKARARQRTFFTKGIAPNIVVLEPISFTTAELDLIVTRGGDRDEEARFWNLFADADVLGALIQPDALLAKRLATHLENDVAAVGDLITQEVLERAHRVLGYAKALAPTYSVAAANPPYMGAGNMGSALVEFAKANYPATKTDLFAMFIERCVSLTQRLGLVAMITMQSWMFLASFEKLRKQILNSSPPVTMAHLGERAFDSIGGAVVSTTAFVLQPGRPTREVGAYLRLVAGRSESEKAEMLRTIASAVTQGGDAGNLFRSSTESFKMIPGTPVVYWLPDRVRRAFALGLPLGDMAELREGLSSSDGPRFVRLWWEVSIRSCNLDAPTPDAAEASRAKWFPFNKGGDFRKWYGNHEYLINWQSGGREILAERPKSTVRSPQFYFRSCASWSKISSGAPSFRSYPEGFVLGSAAKSIFVQPEQKSALIMSICNSSLMELLLQAKSPTMSFVAEDVGSLPIIDSDPNGQVERIADQLVANAKRDWDEFEISWKFRSSPVLSSSDHGRLDKAFEEHYRYWSDLSARQRSLEEENNRAVAKLYGLEDDVPCAVSLERVSLKRNAAFGYPGKPEPERPALFMQDVAKEFVSYSVGCMFGRYSLDEPGLILANQGSTLQDYLARVPIPSFLPDADNVIPVVDGEWFEDDIVTRFRQFLRVAFGEVHFEENLRFVTESLGVRDLRDYFVKSFYTDHVQRYKKRPIYWLFSSPKGSFNALIYMNRYTASTVSTVLNEYLREFKAKLSATLGQQERLAAGGGTPRQQAAAQKEADRIRKMLLELDEYEHDVMYPLASQQIEIDLDDGVKVNYPKFAAALKKIPGLEAGE